MRWSVMALVMLGCAAGGDPGGGGSALPDRGLGAYEPVVDEAGGVVAPVATPEGLLLGNPMAVVDGGRVWLYFDVCDGAGGCEIARAESDDGIVFSGWEAVTAGSVGSLRAPFVLRGGGGWWLYATRGDGIVRAAGDGRRFGEAVEVLSEAGAVLDSPSVVEVDGQVWLYVSRTVDGITGLAVAKASGDGFGALEAVEVPGTVDGTVDGWRPGEVGGAEVRRALSGAGRVVYRLVYAGGRSGDVGFAASFDGLVWSPYAFNPALGDDADERAPSNVRFGGRYLMYFARPQGRLGVAERVVENASEVF